MANLTPKTRKYAVIGATLFLLAALGLGAASMFYVGWIKYTVQRPPAPSPEYVAAEATKFIYHSRHRGLFYYTIDDTTAQIVRNNDNNRYFPVVYNNATSTGTGFWSFTAIMKASVGLHVGYLVAAALVAWMVVFSSCFGRRLIHLATALLVLGLVAGGIGLALFHIYIEMEKYSDITELPDLWYSWTPELKIATSETLYLSYGIHIGSLGSSVLALLLVILLATSWEAPEQLDERAASDKVNIYTRDNLAYDESMMDKPARAELWNGFDRLSDKRSQAPSDRRLRASASFNRGDDYGENGHHHHHHHTYDDRMTSTPTRQHYHTDQGNFPIRY